MNLYGKKVILRALEVSDNDVLMDIMNDPSIEVMLAGASFPVSRYGQNKWFESQTVGTNILRCAVADKKDIKNAMGTVILSDIDYVNGVAQIHIKLAKNAQGKGYGTDAVNTIIKYAFQELRLHCIYAEILSYNESSQRLFLKCGFKCEGVHRGRIFKSGTHQDVKVYSVLKSEYEMDEKNENRNW